MNSNNNFSQRLHASVAQLGARFDDEVLEATRTLYKEHVARFAGIREHLDVGYGDHERHRLDVFAPDGWNLPVVVFVHGGGFIGGNKRGPGGFYDNVGRYFASRGYVAVTMNYRLAPAHGWPAAMQDVAAVLDWVSRRIAEFGGDPAHIGLIGQSAGASHAASFLFDPRCVAQAASQVKAAALLSGFYLASAPLTPGQAAYFGTDKTTYAERSPAEHTKTNPALPILLTVAEFDPPRLTEQTFSLATALARSRGPCPPLHWFEGHNHVSTVMSLGTPQTEVGELLCEFFDLHLARRSD